MGWGARAQAGAAQGPVGDCPVSRVRPIQHFCGLRMLLWSSQRQGTEHLAPRSPQEAQRGHAHVHALPSQMATTNACCWPGSFSPGAYSSCTSCGRSRSRARPGQGMAPPRPSAVPLPLLLGGAPAGHRHCTAPTTSGQGDGAYWVVLVQCAIAVARLRVQPDVRPRARQRGLCVVCERHGLTMCLSIQCSWTEWRRLVDGATTVAVVAGLHRRWRVGGRGCRGREVRLQVTTPCCPAKHATEPQQVGSRLHAGLRHRLTARGSNCGRCTRYACEYPFTQETCPNKQKLGCRRANCACIYIYICASATGC